MFENFLSESILGRAQKSGLVKIELANLRDWGEGKRKTVDDSPYGGGAGMVLRVDIVAKAIEALKKKNKKAKVFLMTPQGRRFNQGMARELTGTDLILVCGHYEGFDERIRDYVDGEISIGDFVLTGGELAAAVITDAVVRLMPGVLGKDESSEKESFEEGLLEYPQFTRPEEFEGKMVPDVLRGGNHAEIEKWRHAEALERTKNRRPDLLG
jgi:tRNA (guanine37-N1)-methyltransferase